MKFEDPENRYGLDALIQSGSSARIYRGTNPDTGGPVAVKILEIGKHDSQGILRRVFLDRSAILSQLEHPSLPVLLEAGLTPDKDAFLVFDWVEGPSVSEIGPISPTDALTAMIRVLEGLECLALHNLVHWNLSPESIILGGSTLPREAIDGAPSPEPRTRVVGLGVSLLPMEWWPHHLEAKGDDTRYIAPELKQLGVAPTAAVGGAWWRCDLYSVAMITCSLLGAEVRGAGTAEPQVETLPGVRTGLHELLEQCLREDPNERPVSFSEVVKIFQHSMPRDRRERRGDVLATNIYALRDLSHEDRELTEDPLSTQDFEAPTVEMVGASHETLPGFVMPEEIRSSRPGIEIASRPLLDPDETQKVTVDLHRAAPASGPDNDDFDTAKVHAPELDLSSSDIDGLLEEQFDDGVGASASSTFAFSDPFEEEDLNGLPVDQVATGADALAERIRRLGSADAEETVALDSPLLAELDNAQQSAAPGPPEPPEQREPTVAERAQPPASLGGAPAPPPSRLGSGALATAALAGKIKNSLKDLLPEPDPTPRDDLLEDVEDFERALTNGRSEPAVPSESDSLGKTATSMPAINPAAPASGVSSAGSAQPEPRAGSGRAGGGSTSATPLLDSMQPGARRPLRLAAVAAALVVGLLLVRAILPDRDVEASRDREIIKVREFSREQPVEVGPAVDPFSAPPPQVLDQEIEQVILAFAAGDLTKARSLLRPMRQRDAAGELPAEMCDIYRPLAESVDRAWIGAALNGLRTGLERADAPALKRTLNSLSAADLRRVRAEPDGVDLLERSNQALDRLDRIEQLLKGGDFEAALESSIALYRDNRGLEQKAKLRDRSAMGLEREIDSLNQSGRHEEARAKLSRLEQIWPDRPGLTERREGVAKSERSQEVYLELLSRAEATLEERPHEGLEILAGAQPPYVLVQRFAALEESLQRRLEQLDAEAPTVRQDASRPIEYRKGRPVVVGLSVGDDYEVIEVSAFVRIEGETDYRPLQVEALGGSSYQFEIPAAVHVDRPIDFYVSARDRSGHTGALSSPEAPTTLKRKRWYN